MSLVARHGDGEVHLGSYERLIEVVQKWDTLITDTPYSEQTHSGHGTVERWGTPTMPAYDGAERQEINYKHWTEADVFKFVGLMGPRTRGWFVTITDDILCPVWKAALRDDGRYVFAPLPFVAPGSRVRLAGDGPSSWTCWIVVARPRNKEFSTWGTLPGAYVLPEGQGGRLPVLGGKPAWLMHRLVEHYSRPSDLVVDPCCGAGTTGVAALREGRRTVMGDIFEPHAQMAAAWMANPHLPAPGRAEARDPGAAQPSLF